MALKPGDVHEPLGKKIRVLIDKSGDHVVYLDEDLNIQWDQAKDLDKQTGLVVNRITHLEGLMGFMQRSDTQSKGEEKRIIAIKSLFGEAYARSYNTHDRESAAQALDDAELQIALWNREVSGRWYFCSALGATALCVVLLLFAQAYRSGITGALGDTAWTVITIGLFGSIGAFTSVCLRHRQLALDANAGLSVHVMEACGRIVIGVVSAMLMILLAKGGLILEIATKSDHAMYVYAALGMLCGASERVLPNFVSRAEMLLDQGGTGPGNGASKGDGVETGLLADHPPKQKSGSRTRAPSTKEGI
jgi:hypothetical protein